jgi:hypothetical protein
MIYIIAALSLFAMLLGTFLVINREGNKEIRQLTDKELESYNTAMKNVEDWSKGEYSQIISLDQIKAFKGAQNET